MKQRGLVIAIGTVVIVCFLWARKAASPSLQPGPEPAPEGAYLLGPGQGETLVGSNGQVTIIASPKTGSSRFAMGTQQLRAGTAIPIHRHEHADEAFFVHEGSGVGIVGENRSVVGKGHAVYVPRGVWHGFEADSEELNVIWVISPPGLDEFFRETRVPPGTPLRSLTPEQLEQIGLKHGVRTRPR